MTKRDDFYFRGFVEQAEFTCQLTNKTYEILRNWETVDFDVVLKEVHSIEHAADEKQHEIMNRLVKEFIAPIEREDIIQLTQSLDDLTDCVEDISVYMYTYGVKTVTAPAMEMLDLIYGSVTELKSLLERFYNFKHDADCNKSVIEINRLEELGDVVYRKSLHELFINETDPIRIIVWKEIYSRLEKTLDTVEDVANEVESIIMKNS